MIPAEGWQLSFTIAMKSFLYQHKCIHTSCLNTNVHAVQANKSRHSKGEVYTLSLVWHTNKRWTTYTSAY